jgi:hypothetical protein
MIFIKIIILLIYANIVEYAIHRWMLHGWLWKQHSGHHGDPEHTVFFVHNLRGILLAALLITMNSLIWQFWGWLPLYVFLFYYFVVLELAHWLIHHTHVGKFHMTHHQDLKEGNWNVWIPIGDWLFHTIIR